MVVLGEERGCQEPFEGVATACSPGVASSRRQCPPCPGCATPGPSARAGCRPCRRPWDRPCSRGCGHAGLGRRCGLGRCCGGGGHGPSRGCGPGGPGRCCGGCARGPSRGCGPGHCGDGLPGRRCGLGRYSCGSFLRRPLEAQEQAGLQGQLQGLARCYDLDRSFSCDGLHGLRGSQARSACHGRGRRGGLGRGEARRCGHLGPRQGQGRGQVGAIPAPDCGLSGRAPCCGPSSSRVRRELQALRLLQASQALQVGPARLGRGFDPGAKARPDAPHCDRGCRPCWEDDRRLLHEASLAHVFRH